MDGPERAGNSGEGISDISRPASDSLSELVKENKLVAILSAFAVGVFLGVLARK